MLEDELHFLLLRGFHYSNKAIIQQIDSLRLLPGQPKILEYLRSHDRAVAKAIGEACVLDKSTVTSLISRMEKQGLIRREEHESDRRSAYIFLTDEGRRCAEEVSKVCLSVDGLAFKGISEEERAHFVKTFQSVISNFKEVIE